MRNFLLCLVVFVTACTDNSVSSDEQAKRAYVALDKSIGKGITLGFAGFNGASSANISPQMAAGDTAGTITITGQVDQGSSANKGMRLNVAMAGYSDGKVTVDGADVTVTYATDATALPALNIMLKGIPTGTMTGTLTGLFHMTGDVTGDVTLNLTFNGMLMAGTGTAVERVAGSTTVTGTAVSGSGTYNVMVTL